MSLRRVPKGSSVGAVLLSIFARKSTRSKNCCTPDGEQLATFSDMYVHPRPSQRRAIMAARVGTSIGVRGPLRGIVYKI